MKKIFTLILACITVLQLSARSLNIIIGDVTYSFPSSTMGIASHDYSSSMLTVLERQFSTASITSMAVVEQDIPDNTVTVTYNGTDAKAVVAGNIARYVDISITGAHVSVSQNDLVDDTTCGEITYSLSGQSSDGSFNLTGSYKSSIDLNGLTLTNPSGAALDIQNGKRIAISAKSETANFLTDGADGAQKGAISCKGHIEFKGKGSLTVAGRKSHAIYAKEYISVKNLTLTVTESVKDGINCTQYFLMESGNLTLNGVGDDGLQCDFKDVEGSREAEDTGSISILGGSINATITSTAAKGLKAEGNFDITDGSVTISVSGSGKWDDTKLKTKAASCISADGDANISGGSLDLTATGAGGKGISCDGTLKVTAGDIKVSTSGGILAYVNGTLYDNYTGNTDNLDSDYKSSPKGIKADTFVQIDGGNINILTTGKGAEGIESKGELVINDGTIFIKAYDDAINSSSHMHINGGNIIVIATNNDGLDSNGHLYINGGYIMAFGAGAPECGLDANTEEGYTVFFTGGTLLAVGGGNSLPTTDASTQPYVTGNSSVTAGTTVQLKNGNNVLAQFIVPAEYTGNNGGGNNPPTPPSNAPGGGPGGNPGGGPGGPGGMGGGLAITCPGLTSGSSYSLVIGSTTSTVTAALKGSSSQPGRP